jgi:hypothetical protein
MRPERCKPYAGHIHVLAEHVAESCHPAGALSGKQLVLDALHVDGRRFSPCRSDACQTDGKR